VLDNGGSNPYDNIGNFYIKEKDLEKSRYRKRYTFEETKDTFYLIF